MQYFSERLDIAETAQALKMNRRTAGRYYLLFRHLIVDHLEKCVQEEADSAVLGDIKLRTYPRRGRILLPQKLNAPNWGIYRLKRGYILMGLPPCLSIFTVRAILRHNARLEPSYLKPDPGQYRMSFIEQEPWGMSTAEPVRVPTLWTHLLASLQANPGIKRKYLYLHIREFEFRYNFRDRSEFQKTLWKRLLLYYRQTIRKGTNINRCTVWVLIISFHEFIRNEWICTTYYNALM